MFFCWKPEQSFQALSLCLILALIPVLYAVLNDKSIFETFVIIFLCLIFYERLISVIYLPTAKALKLITWKENYWTLIYSGYEFKGKIDSGSLNLPGIVYLSLKNDEGKSIQLFLFSDSFATADVKSSDEPWRSFHFCFHVSR